MTLKLKKAAPLKGEPRLRVVVDRMMTRKQLLRLARQITYSATDMQYAKPQEIDHV